MQTITGKTRDTGYQAGVQKTFPVTVQEAWKYLFSEKGIQIWLGYYGNAEWVRGQKYVTKYGTQICVRLYRELSHARLKYQKKDWQNISTIQVRVTASKTGATISFHQENLAGTEQREEMKRHWEKVLDNIKAGLKLK